MIRRKRLLFAAFVAVLFVYFIVYKYDFNVPKLGEGDSNLHQVVVSSNLEVKKEENVALAAVVCENRLEESLTMIKSALLLTKAPVQLYIFADEANRPLFIKRVII